jgi:hypothetical protein
MLAVQAVSCEPVSRSHSLMVGKIQGIGGNQKSTGSGDLPFYQQVSVVIPCLENREVPNLEQRTLATKQGNKPKQRGRVSLPRRPRYYIVHTTSHAFGVDVHAF